jgi:signal transduction histidine kinase
LIETINLTYKENEEGRYLLERSLEISSREMSQKLIDNREMSVQLAQANKLASLGTLASGIAHELNNPLAILKLQVELMQESPGVPEELSSGLAKVLKLTDRMSGTVRHLLKLSRKSSDSVHAVFDLREPIMDCHQLLVRQLEVDGITVELDLGTSPILVKADPNQLFGVFQNLFSNARDALVMGDPTGRRISISIRESTADSQDVADIKFSDNAGGIAPEVVGKIFDPYFTTKEAGKGTGLGLALSKQSLDEMGATIKVETQVGRGTDFLIRVPVFAKKSDAKVESISAATKIDYKKIATDHLSILVVDDEPTICDSIKRVLMDQFDVTALSDAPAAIELLKRKSFQVVLTDMKMPGASGDQVMRAARETNPDVKLVLMSGHLREELVLDGVGNDYLFIEKPFGSIQAFRKTIFDYAHREKKSA